MEFDLINERRQSATNGTKTNFELRQTIMQLENDLKREHSLNAELKLSISTVQGKYDQSNKHVVKWTKKYELLKKDLVETRDVIILYEGLMAKLTEQNAKLKDWIKTKKREEKI